MIERITDYPGYLIRFMPEKPCSQVVLLLHGLPAHRGTKNLDLAEYLHISLNACVYILHYPGLGESRGEFGFTKSVEASISVARKVTKAHPGSDFTIIGHSWGGMVAVNIATEMPVSKTVLLSPYCGGTASDPLYSWMLDGLEQDWPGIYGESSREDRARDIQHLWSKHSPMVLAGRLPKDLRLAVIQAASDDITPAEKTKAFCKSLSFKSLYVEVDMDHSFSQNRPLLCRTVYEVLSKMGTAST